MINSKDIQVIGYVVRHFNDCFTVARSSSMPQLYSSYAKAKQAHERSYRKEGVDYVIHKVTFTVAECNIVKEQLGD